MEEELIEASKRGDSEAFGRLVRKYEDRIFRLARSVCAAAPSEADDVHQETFLTAFKKIGDFRGEAGLGTWLQRIAANLCWMRLRDKKRAKLVPLPGGEDGEGGGDLPDLSPLPEEAARKTQLREAVIKALSELPEDYRLVVTLRDVEGLCAEETAKALDLSVAAVKSRLHRGRSLLRDRFNESWK
ncbi:MAG: sigma-70 family RNA polymerase sigma factor [Elusimicrobiota bacterium]